MSDLQITQEILAGLELARDQLAAMLEKGERCRLGAHPGLGGLGPSCDCGAGVDDETIKNAIRPFMETWALFPFDISLAAIRGQADEAELSYLAAVATGKASTGAAPAERRQLARTRIAA